MSDDIDSAVALVRAAASRVRAMSDADLASSIRALPEIDLAGLSARLGPAPPSAKHPVPRKKEVARRTADPIEARQRRPQGSIAAMILNRLSAGDAPWSELKTLGISNGRLHTTIQNLIRENKVEWFGDPKRRVYRLVSRGQSTTTASQSVQ